MLKYQIHKLSKGAKEARAILLEDILTSDVFGLMSYLPYELLFKSFLERLKTGNPESDFFVPKSEPVAMYFWKSFTWPECLPNLERDSIEPDVVVEWSETLLIIEAKFKSTTDPEELLREYLLGHYEARTDKKAFLLLIDKNFSQPKLKHTKNPDRVTVSEYLQNRIEELQLSDNFPLGTVESSFLWTNWQCFYTQVETLKNEVLSGVNGSFESTASKILDDMLEILNRKGLEAFEDLELAAFYKYDVNLNSLGQIGRMTNDPLPSLSRFSLDTESLIDLLPFEHRGYN